MKTFTKYQTTQAIEHLEKSLTDKVDINAFKVLAYSYSTRKEMTGMLSESCKEKEIQLYNLQNKYAALKRKYYDLKRSIEE